MCAPTDAFARIYKQLATMFTKRTQTSDITVHEKIGSGTFSEIYRITFSADPQKSFALKLLSPFHSHLVENERGALEKVPVHPNIIKCFREFEEIFVHGRVWKSIVLQYAEHGDLFSVISNKGKLSEEMAHAYYKQISDALNAAHAVHVYHRDIKLENILIGGDGEVLIGDWGLSSCCPEGVAHTTTLVGTIGYMEPDMFLRNQVYELATADFWAALCVFFTCVVGHPPFGKAHASDYHYACMMSDSKKFWRSIGKYNSISQKFTNISSEMATFFTEKFQRVPK